MTFVFEACEWICVCVCVCEWEREREREIERQERGPKFLTFAEECCDRLKNVAHCCWLNIFPSFRSLLLSIHFSFEKKVSNMEAKNVAEKDFFSHSNHEHSCDGMFAARLVGRVCLSSWRRPGGHCLNNVSNVEMRGRGIWSNVISFKWKPKKRLDKRFS